jgi:hypothetical protein
MAKGKHRQARRIILPNGMWVLLYDDGAIKIAGYDRSLVVTEVQTRAGGAHVFIGVHEETDRPRETSERGADLVTVPRAVAEALNLVSRQALSEASAHDQFDDDGEPV